MSTQSLHSFLSSIQLQDYYNAFLKAGASEQDLPLLIQFTDNELVEFISALNMLPFHVIKFKKALRELKNNNVPSERDQVLPLSSDHSVITREYIAANSIIYGKNTNRTLTSYEDAINRASFQLALDNPLLLSKKGDLFDLAKKKLLEEGYQYKRGSSRSKLKNATASPIIKKKRKENVLIKRQENAQKLSQARREKIACLREQLLVIDHNTEAKDIELITNELNKLKDQERKHQWYNKRKNLLSISSLSSSNTEEVPFSSLSLSPSSSCTSVEEDEPYYYPIYYPHDFKQ